MPESVFTVRRSRAVAIHIAASLLIAAVVGALVFLVWYPQPFDVIAGGTGLFLLLVGVDVVLGPALTAVVANPAKPLPELRRDLAVIVLLQLAGLGYGLHTMALARPVWLAFEIDRFRVVMAADIEPTTLGDAPPGLRSLPWTGPRTIAAVKPTEPAEQMKSVELGLAGIDLAMVPRNWRDYASQTDRAWRVARPVAALLKQYPQEATAVVQAAARSGVAVESMRFLPLMSRSASWVALIAAPDARVVGYVAQDGFF